MGWRLLKTHEYPTGRPNSTAVGRSAARKARFANACFTHVAPSRRLGNCSCVALPYAIHGGRLTRGFQKPPPHHPAVPLASNEKALWSLRSTFSNVALRDGGFSARGPSPEWMRVPSLQGRIHGVSQSAKPFVPPSTEFQKSMTEMTHAGKHHRHTMLIRRCNNFLI